MGDFFKRNFGFDPERDIVAPPRSVKPWVLGALTFVACFMVYIISQT